MLNKQVLRIEKPLGYMLNEQVLRVKKTTNQALKTQVHELNTPFFLTTSVPSTTQTAPKPLPLIRKHVSRQAHPLPLEGLGEASSQDLFTPSLSHCFLSHPLLRRGLGRLLLFGFWGASLVRAWSLFVNFFPSSFPIYALSPSKRRPFAS